MRLTINLATRPYVELDRIFRQLRLAIGVLALTALGLVFWLHAQSAQAREQQRQIEAIQAKSVALDAERTRNEQRLRQPANAAVLQQVEFLNGLFQRKSFSWTAVLMDLEEVLPAGVQVTSIDPQIQSTGEVNIRMRVSGPREKSVQLLRNLEGSHRFIAPRLVGEAQQQQEKGTGVAVPSAYLANGAGTGVAVPSAYLGNGARPGEAAPAGPPATDFDLVAGYNPLQPRVRERAARAKTNAATVEEEAVTP